MFLMENSGPFTIYLRIFLADKDVWDLIDYCNEITKLNIYLNVNEIIKS